MLYTETPEIHMHTLKIGVLDVSNVGGYDFDLFRAIAFPRLQAMAPLRYQLVDIPMKLHHPCGCSMTTSTSTITFARPWCPRRVGAGNWTS